MLETLNVALLRCPVVFSEEFIAFSQMKMSQIDTKNDKNSKKFPIFKDVMHFIPNFLWTLWIGTLKRVNKGRMSCPVGFPKSLLQFSK